MRDFPSDGIYFLDKKSYVHIYGQRLPHWFQEHKTVFVTFRLADSLPQAKLDELKRMERELATKRWMGATAGDLRMQSLAVARRIERWTDAGHGSCLLTDARAQGIVADAIRFFDGESCLVHAFVIMPNHVHLLLTPLSAVPVTDLMAKVKGFTAHRINEALHRTGAVWQRGIFDRIVRDADNFWQCLAYIRNNPRHLRPGTWLLYVRERHGGEE